MRKLLVAWCPGVLTLLFGVLVAPLSANAQCPGVPPAGCCDGTVYNGCSGATPTYQDCIFMGQVCGEDDRFPGVVGCIDSMWNSGADVTCNACTPDCTGKVCGDDGCGGTLLESSIHRGKTQNALVVVGGW